MRNIVSEDATFFKNHLNNFLNSKTCDYSKKLTYFSQNESDEVVNGWEKWLQFEFLFYMTNHQNEFYKPKKENRYELDGRKSDSKTMLVDLTFKRNPKNLSGTVFLELKRSKTLSRLIEKMIDDAVKLQSIKKSQDDSRTCWLLGFTPYNESAEQFSQLLNEIKPDFFSCLKDSNSKVFTFGNHGVVLYGFTL